VLGARMVTCWGDEGLAKAAEDILAKVDAVLPAPLKKSLHTTSLYAPAFASPALGTEYMAQLRKAVRVKRKVRLLYTDGQGEATKRIIRPLGLAVFAPRWLLTAWCELRHGFRNFRLDRIQSLEMLEESFADEPGKTFNDFLKLVTQ
ncbi:helix-turn-helix transcriptional regulator, partial [Planctomycetota bacterium]